MEVEERVVTNLSRYIEEQTDHVSSHVEHALDTLNERIVQLERHLAPSAKGDKVIHAHQIMENGQIDPVKIEKALNSWLERVED